MANNEPRVVIGGASKHRLPHVSKQTAIIGGAVVVVIIVAVTLALSRHTAKPASPTNKGSLTTIQLNQQVSGQIQKHDLKGAESTLQSQNATTQTISGYLSLASVQAGLNKYDDALKTLQQAQTKFGASYTLDLRFAQVYTQKKDYTNAIMYYQKAISLLQADHSLATNPDQTITQLQAVVSSLQKAKK